MRLGVEHVANQEYDWRPRPTPGYGLGIGITYMHVHGILIEPCRACKDDLAAWLSTVLQVTEMLAGQTCLSDSPRTMCEA